MVSVALCTTGSHHILEVVGSAFVQLRCVSVKWTPTAVLFAVPQEFVLGPFLFLHNAADLLELMETPGLCPHADDTQIDGFYHPSDSSQFTKSRVCVRWGRRLMPWMQSNWLQLNTSKAGGSLVCAGSYEAPDSRRVNDGGLGYRSIHPVCQTSRLDSDLLMRTYVMQFCV